MKTIYIFVCIGLYVSMLDAQQKDSSKRKVLIIDGFSNHDWRQTTKITLQILERSGLFSSSVSTMPLPVGDKNRLDWLPHLAGYNVIIQNTNNINDTSIRWPVAMEKQLKKYVHSGGGLYILHSGNNALPHWKQYDTIIGLGWRKADEG